MIKKTASGLKYHAKVESNGIIGHAINATPEAAFMNAAIARCETERELTAFTKIYSVNLFGHGNYSSPLYANGGQ